MEESAVINGWQKRKSSVMRGFRNGDELLSLNFEESIHMNDDSLELVDNANEFKDCFHCKEKEQEIDNFKVLISNYEKQGNENRQLILNFQDKIQKLTTQLQNVEEINRTTSSSKSSTNIMNQVMPLGSKRNMNTPENNWAQEFLQKNIIKEEENRKLKLRIEQLKTESIENQKAYSRRIELMYSVISSFYYE